jgi:hypothetical protein
VRRTFAFVPVLALAGAAALYLLSLYGGAVTLIGYESGSERHQGWSTTYWFPVAFRLPVIWLHAGDAVRADYDVDAPYGALAIDVAPPLILKTSLQTATAYVEGQRSGSVMFIAQTPGWYVFWATPSVLGGPRCPEPPDLAKSFLGLSKCVGYDVTYRVTWRLTDAREAHAGVPRLTVPRPNEKLVTLRIN